MNIHLASLGCAKNLVDSELLLARLAAAGAVVGATPEEADVIIVNTCGFIGPAKEESINTIIELAQQKSLGRCRRLIVMGCLAQRYAESLRKELPEIDAIFGLNQTEDIVRACGLRLKRGDPGRLLLTPKHSAYLRISDGCDNRCAYCAIPIIRGPYRSRPFKEILAEAQRLVKSGVRELNVIGQDTTMYGNDKPRGPRIQDLLVELSKIPDLHWLRLLYTHPAHFTSALVEAFADIPNLLPYVDLPLQHLNDEILKRMGRRVTQAQILELISSLRARMPDIAIRTSFIVGFPGETRQQFNELLRLTSELRFEHVGVFPYSREEQTPAARFRNQISEQAKTRRRRELMLAQQEIVLKRNEAMLEKTIELLVDRPGPDAETWIARSAAQAPDVDSVTFLKGASHEPGSFITARIIGAQGYDLVAVGV